MERRPAPNERQRELLERLATGEESGALTPRDWRSAYALRDRGLLTVDKGGGAARAEITEAGRFYVRHGRHPDDAESADRGEPSAPVEPSASYGERPVARARQAKARELVERLLAEGHVRFAHADDEEIAEWRRVVNYAKRHGMEPEGKRIEKVPYGRLGLEFFLAKGPHPNARSQRPKADAPTVRVPTRLASLHPVVAALKDDVRRLVMPPALRRRSLLMLQGLASEAARRGHEVRKAGSSYRPREGGMDVVVEGFAYPVTIRQEFPESTDPERSSRLVVEVAHGLTGRPGRWRDRKSRTLEQSLGLVLGEIEARAVEDARRRESEERAREERAVRWREAMEEAKELAVREQFAEVLREEAGRWREAVVIGEYCDALEHRLIELDGGADEQALESVRRWLEWARGYGRAIDPLGQPQGMPIPRDPTADELRPYLRGWSPEGPERRAGR
ncbi:hypothetical protein [Streptomyces griseiscabiei]|uniref:PE-PGRS family protein n=1 Tax=Streptomyces griseiscabiei TaxID=2993540 RepID=A0ABU4KXK5_9ACTN|nr:hypothetical protein [Streptomyces griseiscabiei]MDX2908121.1 hypothetical protein [Streptomyces griseiscabiei]